MSDLSKVNLTLRAEKGAPLTTEEMDANLRAIAALLNGLQTAIQTAEAGAVRPVTALPDVSLAKENDVVFNLADNQLYRLTSGKWVKMVQEVNAKVEITDESITTPKLAARVITADKMAVNSITAGNAALAQAAVGTLSIAGNAVTLCQTARTTNQYEVSSDQYTDMLTASVTVTGLQPILVWGAYSFGGAHIGTSSDYNDFYQGKYWKYNTNRSGQDVRFCLRGGNTYYSDEITGITVFAGTGGAGSAMGVFTGIAAGTYTLCLQVRKSAANVENTWVRNLYMAMLETKR